MDCNSVDQSEIHLSNGDKETDAQITIDHAFKDGEDAENEIGLKSQQVREKESAIEEHIEENESNENDVNDQNHVTGGKSINNEKDMSLNVVDTRPGQVDNLDSIGENEFDNAQEKSSNDEDGQRICEPLANKIIAQSDACEDGHVAQSNACEDEHVAQNNASEDELAMDPLSIKVDPIIGERGSPEGISEELQSLNKKESDQPISDEVQKDTTTLEKNKTADSESLETTQPEKAEKENEWLDILGNGLLRKKVIIKGKGEATRPTSGCEVVIKVAGELLNGAILKEEELTFVLDDREVIQAFDLAVALMELGEKAVLDTNAKYAYGPFGCNEKGLEIPPNSNIRYELELVSISEFEDKDKISDENKVKIGDRKRNRGNSFYSRGDYGGAIDCYKRALKFLEGSSNDKVQEMRMKCQNNLSAAQIKINAFQAALMSCNSVLHAQPDNVKAVFRKGKCLEGLGESEEALKWMKKASMLDPSSKMIQNELIRIGNYVKKSRKKESDMYKRMVNGLKDQGDESRIDDSSFSWKLVVGTMMVASIGIIAGFFIYRH